MRQVHIVDTSILCCLLRVPNFCNEYLDVEDEFVSIINRDDTLILPMATILETGNHIAHIPDGRIRRSIAQKFADYLKDTAESKAPWSLISLEWTSQDLIKFAEAFPDEAMRGKGLGDMSIIDTYEDYKSRTPGVSIRIWSMDQHLSAYCCQATAIGRRNRH